MQYIADSAASRHMKPDADGLTNYRECSRPLGLANGGATSIAGYGDLTVAFRSDNTWVHIKLHDVSHTPLLSYNLISLPSLALKDHMYAGDKYEVTLKLRGGKTLRSPLIGKLCRQYGYRPEANKGRVVNTACAVIAPLRPHTRGTSQESGGAARSQPQRVTPRVSGVFNGEGATEAHRQADAHQSRYPLPLPRPRINCPLLPKTGSL